MKAAAGEEGIEMHLVSAYRSVDRQAGLIRRKLDAGRSLDAILEVLAPPGCSEHHTGRAVDIGTGDLRPLEPDFDRAPAFAWLGVHAHRFGFGLSFPRGNAFGYVYEPWHWCFSETGDRSFRDFESTARFP
ncbi:M15 family metallopeptidase [Imhoffiella purpurea]